MSGHDEQRKSQGDASIELVLQLAEPRGDDRVIDYGAGVGALTFALAPKVHAIAAVDDRPAAIEEARRLGAEVGIDNVTCSAVDLYALPFPHDSFSLGVSRLAIHRLPQPVPAFKELARTIDVGGRIVVLDIVVDTDVDRYINELAKLSDPAHRRHATRAEHLDSFAKAGLALTGEAGDRQTVDLKYWLEARAVDPDHADLIRTRLQEFPLKIQTAIDLAVADKMATFSYDIVAFRLERA